MKPARKVRCSLCQKKFASEKAVLDHIAIHTKNGKQAKPEPVPVTSDDHSEAEWYLQTHYGI